MSPDGPHSRCATCGAARIMEPGFGLPRERTMRRISISEAMLVVAFVAAHLVLLRFLISTLQSGFHLTLLVGLLPLAEAQLIGLYLTAKRYRLTLKRRNDSYRGINVIAFSAFNAIALILLRRLRRPAEGRTAVSRPFRPSQQLVPLVGIYPRGFRGSILPVICVPLNLGGHDVWPSLAAQSYLRLAGRQV